MERTASSEAAGRLGLPECRVEEEEAGRVENTERSQRFGGYGGTTKVRSSPEVGSPKRLLGEGCSPMVSLRWGRFRAELPSGFELSD